MGKLKGKVKARNRKKTIKDKKISKQAYVKNLLKDIKTYDYPSLLKESTDVEDINNNEVQEIIRKIGKTLYYCENGVGIAACQLGYNYKIMAVKNIEDKNKIMIFVNPEFEKISEETSTLEEGCLSYPGIGADVSRYKEIKVRYLNEEGESKEETYKDMLARIIQHEIEHFSGSCALYKAWIEKKKG